MCAFVEDMISALDLCIMNMDDANLSNAQLTLLVNTIKKVFFQFQSK